MPEGPVRVLLIEDEHDDYLLIQDLFGEFPPGRYYLDRVADYDSALHAFVHCDHDVYLVDYRLGQKTGVDVVTDAIRLGCHKPMIMLTGQREAEIDLLAMQAGAVDYLVKDRLEAETLERTLRYALEQKRHAEAIRRANTQLEERVRERTAELARLNETLQSEIAERQRAEEALREADRHKDEFLATLAHEMRNPLSPLVSALQLMEMAPNDTAQLASLRSIMARQVEQLSRLIDDLSDVSRVSQGKLSLRWERISLADVIKAALDVSRSRIDDAGHMLTVALPSRDVTIDGDKVRLSQIVSNVLINAAKYTPAGGKIDLSAQQEGDRVVISVKDNGVGISPQMLPKIFELYAQVHLSKQHSQGGLGIGLTLARTLVKMHGGAIEARSAGEGQGSEFIVRVPLRNAAVQAEEPPPLATSGEPGELARFRILIVDDNEAPAHLLGRLLQKLGQSVTTASSAAAALDACQMFRPDVIISDIAMPEMTGYELARHIRAVAGFRQPVLIALTGYSQESDRQAALAAGFDYHLTKPVGLAELEQLLTQLPAPID